MSGGAVLPLVVKEHGGQRAHQICRSLTMPRRKSQNASHISAYLYHVSCVSLMRCLCCILTCCSASPLGTFATAWGGMPCAGQASSVVTHSACCCCSCCCCWHAEHASKSDTPRLRPRARALHCTSLHCTAWHAACEAPRYIVCRGRTLWASLVPGPMPLQAAPPPPQPTNDVHMHAHMCAHMRHRGAPRSASRCTIVCGVNVFELPKLP